MSVVGYIYDIEPVEPVRLSDQSSSDQRIVSTPILLSLPPLPRGSRHPTYLNATLCLLLFYYIHGLLLLFYYYNFSKISAPRAAFGAIGIAMAPAAWKCICCKLKSGTPRASANSKRCTASQCVKALTVLRNQEKELRQQQSPGVPHTESDIIPHDMAVVTITEILGERCCRPADMAAKRRRCGPRERDRARGQEYLVRGLFDGDDDEE